MRSLTIQILLVTALLFAGCRRSPEKTKFTYSLAQNDHRVMIQGFYWESYRHGHTAQFPEIWDGHANVPQYWYEIVEGKAPELKSGRFDMIWLPPPSQAGGGAGYSPTELFNPSNMYGDSALHRAMLEALWLNGVEPLADIVINHRNGSNSWAGFKKPSWNTTSICRSDEAFTNPGSEVFGTPQHLRGNDEETIIYDNSRVVTYAYESFRDIDHTDDTVKADIIRYLFFLKSMGYRGWRYDMVHGFHAHHIAAYNAYSEPTFSVGEYDWDKQPGQRGWVWNSAIDTTKQGNERLTTASSIFDFTTHFTLESSIGRGSNNNPDYMALYAFNNGLGLMGDNTDGLAWKNRAVTFLENHDTGWRTNEDGSNQENHDFDSFENNRQVEQGYAYILTHPGIPCVYWKHYFDWGQVLQDKIKALINARKIAGVHSGSNIHTQNNARNAGVYGAMIEGTKGELYVRIGGEDVQWNPALSGYTGFTEYAYGTNWKVWVKLNDSQANSSFQQYPLNSALTGIPQPVNASNIVVPED